MGPFDTPSAPRLSGHPDSCIGCIRNRARGANLQGHRFYRKRPAAPVIGSAGLSLFQNLLLEIDPMLAKRTGAASSEGASCPTWARSLPFLWDFLSQSKWPDGSPRPLGTLLVFIDEGRVKICLNDKAQEQVAFVALPESSFEDDPTPFEVADKAISDSTTDWRPAKRYSGRK